MKRLGYSSWILILFLLALPLVVVSSANAGQEGTESTKLVREVTLAGLRPGKDAVESAYRRFGKENVDKHLSTDTTVSWRDECNHQELTVGIGPSGVIREVTVGPPIAVTDADCFQKAYSREVRARFGSGRGLLLGDRCGRVREISTASLGPRAHPRTEMTSWNPMCTALMGRANVRRSDWKLPATHPRIGWRESS